MATFTNDYSLLPLYTPSEPSPEYSYEPACDEQRLQHTPRHSRPVPNGIYIKDSGNVKVTLFDQENNVTLPTYGRHGFVNGAVYLENSEKISRIIIKIEGKLETITSEGGSKSSTLLAICFTLWELKTEDATCPSLLPFSFTLPSTYDHNGVKRALPPSYNLTCPGTPGFVVRSQYSVTIHATRCRRHNLDLLPKKMKTIEIPFNYFPRTRAHRPIVPAPCFFSTVKTSPEEWYQVSSPIQTRPKSQLEPIYCHFFIPGSRVYGLTDSIPFHIQINGPLNPLEEFLKLHSRVTGPSENRVTRKKLPPKPIIKVYLLRQTQVETQGQRTWRNATLGEGVIWETPPSIFEPRDAAHLDWEGKVRCKEDVSVGGFEAANVVVKDFIVLVIDPPEENRKPSPFLSLQITVPIRLVTDSWVEVTDYEPLGT